MGTWFNPQDGRRPVTQANISPSLYIFYWLRLALALPATTSIPSSARASPRVLHCRDAVWVPFTLLRMLSQTACSIASVQKHGEMLPRSD